MSYYTYPLQSCITDRYYCGQCNHVIGRLKRHNAGEMISTKAERPWKLVGYLEFDTRVLAARMKRKIKGRGIGRWLQ